MNKIKLQQQVDKLESKLAELKAELNKPEPVINYWKPGPSEKHWYVNLYGDTIENITISRSLITKGHYRVFKTQEQAQAYADYIKAEEVLKAEIARLNEGWWPNWKNSVQLKVFIKYASEGLILDWCWETKIHPSFMYLKSKKLAHQLTQTHSKELHTYLTY